MNTKTCTTKVLGGKHTWQLWKYIWYQ